LTGLDANVLLRYFAADDPVQFVKAKEIMEQHLTEDEPGYISVVAMVELVSVLRSRYKLTPTELALGVQTLLQADTLVVQEEQAVYLAMRALKSGLGSFSDVLIAELGARAGCGATLTFDRKAARLDGFQLIA
jgi:predicted nucleic-acid-binding protein